MKRVPACLVGLRVALGPLLFWLLLNGKFTVAAVTYFSAIISDIFDGVIARRLGVSTQELRLADSYADIWLHLCLGLGLLAGFGRGLAPLATPFYTSMALQTASWLFSLARVRKLTSYHSFLAKLTGLCLCVGILSLLLGGVTWPLAIALWVFVIALLEEIVMTAVLPRYHHDIWTFQQALRLRHEDLSRGPSQS